MEPMKVFIFFFVIYDLFLFLFISFLESYFLHIPNRLGYMITNLKKIYKKQKKRPFKGVFLL